MRYSLSFLALAAPLLASAAPAQFLGKRAASDILVFKFADVLEQLESSFYQQAIAKFQDADFTAAGFPSSQIPIEQFKSIQADEATHSTVLQAALKSFGETPITGCQFNFDSALTDVATMAATARVVESVGVSAYLGGATLITDPVLLTSAGSILTVEARHQTILNVLSSSGTAIPAAFDFALTPSEVLALASPFITGGCDIPIPANTPLSLTNTGTVAPGTKLTFSATSLNGTVPDDQLHCQMLLGGSSMSIALPMSECVVPEGINGPVAIWVTSDNQPLLNNVRDRATTKVVAGPALAFIDTQPQMLGQLARGSGSGSGSQSQATSPTTRTISPAEASSVIASASGAAPAAPTSTDAPGASAQSGAPSNGTANLFTGKSPDGKITVNGWTGL
ncbi:ferritin-like domain-containing protein [Collybia nuda]|uniref:Ferritin-like domain-containing protein n=1 Tax=Collybia nuda TaxID=64659 RepID=A0A9P6CKZ7_9AGAR|nr:ferritin-like domain-containing protein [Collybia nuda]